MESRSHAIAAGLFAIILSAGLVLAMWWFSDKREATRELVLVTSGSVNGLNPQATVRYRGIVAGKVAGIGLDPGNPRDVLVTVRIRADLPITQGTRARLATQGVTGLAFIALDDNGENAAPLADVGGEPPRIRLAPGLIGLSLINPLSLMAAKWEGRLKARDRASVEAIEEKEATA